jgi:hypothetical protein
MSAGAAGPNPVSALILGLVRLRARRLALWMQLVWQSGQSSPDQGLAITAGEVARLLDADGAAAQEVRFYAEDEAARSLGAAIVAAATALAGNAGWAGLCESFGLDADEADLLALLLAVELDPGLHRVIAYLHDDTRQIHPTAYLSQRLAGRIPAPFAGTAIASWRLAAPVDDAAPLHLTTPWRADPAVVLAIVTGSWRDPQITAAVREITPEAAAGICLHPGALTALQGIADPCEAELVGATGVGRQTLAAQYAASRRQSLLAADLAAILDRGVSGGEAIVRVLRHARAIGAIAYFRDADALPNLQWLQARQLGVPFLRGVRQESGAALPIVFEPLPTACRLAAWRAVSAVAPPPELSTHRLSPAEIARAAAAPHRPIAGWDGPRTIENGLLARLPCPYTWDDLVLPGEVRRQLGEFEDQVRLRWAVYEDWGFHRLTHLGSGIAALFGGPSGTGKTMAAQVLARALGLDLYRVDLAGVVNKYIGETEKRLREVFDACEHAGALLFFDEADALFGSRMQVKDAHDRFANIEIDYLLQRIERFDGVAILATNRRGDLDTAFVRRLRFVVEFLPPRPEERLALWRRALLPLAPNGEALLDPIDWPMLAERLQMTGAEIKGTTLAAAFLAKAEGTRIGMRHLLAAAQRELAKQGNKLRVPLLEVAA